VLPVLVIGDRRLSGVNPAGIDAALASANNQKQRDALTCLASPGSAHHSFGAYGIQVL